MSNLLVNMSNNNLQLSGNQNTKKKNEQNSFLNLLNVVMQNKNYINETDSSTSNNAIISMFLNGNLNEQISMMESNISNDDIINLMQEDNQKEKLINLTDTDYNNLTGMFLNITQNISYPEMQKLNSEEIVNYSARSILQVSDIESLVTSANVENNYNKGLSENTATTKKNSSNNLFISNEFPRITKEGNIIKKIEGSDRIISNIESGDFKSTINSKLGSLKEEELDQNVKMKNESNVLDFNRGIVETKNVIYSNNNKIIEINDESSEIKTTVLNQVKDKIVLMANDKEGTQEVNMELFPENLGKVNIKMSINAEKITVEIMALSEKTENLLLTNVQELTKVLQNNFNNGTVNVIVTENSLNQYNQSSLNYNQQQNSKEQNYKNQFLNNDITDGNEDNKITEMINIRNLKLNKVV